MLKLHSKVSYEKLKELHEAQDYIRNGSQITGDCMLWMNGSDIDDVNHLKQAPVNTQIQVREHYRYNVILQKLPSGDWVVTEITQR